MQRKRSIQFSLFETILWHKRFVYLYDHMRRLKASACYFSWSFPRHSIHKVLKTTAQPFKQQERYRVRLILKRNGTVRCEAFPLEKESPALALLILSPKPIRREPIFLYHKTTYRPWYENALKHIRHNKCYDVLFYNERGEITEGARTNIFVQKKDILYTPPVRSGLLPGVLRNRMLKRHACREKTITLQELKRAQALFCGNSVRGLQRVRLVS